MAPFTGPWIECVTTFLIGCLIWSVQSGSKGDCSYRPTCHACVNASSRCSWYGEIDFDKTRRPQGRCASSFANFPSTHKESFIQSKSFISNNPGLFVPCTIYDKSIPDRVCGEEINDIPDSAADREIKIKLRARDQFVFSVPVQPVPDIPFQIYFLLDSSRSNLRALSHLQTSTKQLAEDILSTWDGSEVGLGLFADKQSIPFEFVNLTSRELIENIPEFEFPYWTMTSNLTQNGTAFNEAVDAIKMEKLHLQDIDNDPEAQMDVILQVLLCKEMLGFSDEGVGRSSSSNRQVVFLITDSPFWTAGDGRYGNIIKPVTRQCRGHNTADQSRSTINFDHPTISYFKSVLKQQGMFLMAAVNNDKFASSHVRSYADINHRDYKHLMTAIDGMGQYMPNFFNSRGNASFLDESQNVDRSLDILDSLTKKVSLVATGQTSKFLIETYIETEDCPPGSTGVLAPGTATGTRRVVACDGVDPRDTVRVHVGIKLRAGATLDRKQTFVLNIPGVHQSHNLFTVTVENLDVECDCKKTDSKILKKNPNVCTNGALECGVCKCRVPYEGTFCNCIPKQSKVVDPKCVGLLDPSVACNGKGSCKCGQCECDYTNRGVKYVGDKCACDPEKCPVGFNGETCWGRGQCICDGETAHMNCECDDKAYNQSQNCRCKNDGVCIDPYSPPSVGVCNGRATCSCDGKCRCRGGFTGIYCENCDNKRCKNAVVEEVLTEELIYCELNPTNPECEDRKRDFENRFVVVRERKLPGESEDEDAGKDTWIKGQALVGGGCKVNFYAAVQNNSTVYRIIVDKRVICFEYEHGWWVWLLVALTIFLTFLAGLLIITLLKWHVDNEVTSDHNRLLKEKKSKYDSVGEGKKK